MKKGTLLAISMLFTVTLLTTTQGFCKKHVDMVDPTFARENFVRDQQRNSPEVEANKEMDRIAQPDCSTYERFERDQMIERGEIRYVSSELLSDAFLAFVEQYKEDKHLSRTRR